MDRMVKRKRFVGEKGREGGSEGSEGGSERGRERE